MASYPDLQLYVAGEWRKADGQPVFNPADESVLGTLPHATRANLDDALAAAEQGFKSWSRTSPAKRAEIILEAVRIIRGRVEDMALAMTLEQGKPIAQSRLEILRGCDIIEWDAQEGRRIYGRIIPGERGMRHSVLRQPIGVVAAFSPWNFPMSSPARKVGGALSAGCAIILKASEETPAGAVQLVQAFVDAGLPAGVLNLLFGKPSEISEYLIPQPSVRLVTFTGSVPVGKHLSAIAGAHMKPAIMELGGHAPVIMCDDIDPVSAASTSAVAKSRNAGQVCVSPTRFYVHEKIYNKFVEGFAARAKAVPVGDGIEEKNRMGPLVHARRMAAIDALVDDAKKSGAKLQAGGARLKSPGYFYAPTVLSDVPNTARIMNEEPFGPVAVINSFTDYDAVIQQANRLPYGLAAFAFTNSAHRAKLVGEQLEAGMVGVNTFQISVPESPFGGVKESGHGSEEGIEGLEACLVTKFISEA